jgi:hypothetical protein
MKPDNLALGREIISGIIQTESLIAWDKMHDSVRPIEAIQGGIRYSNLLFEDISREWTLLLNCIFCYLPNMKKVMVTHQNGWVAGHIGFQHDRHENWDFRLNSFYFLMDFSLQQTL